MKCLTPISKRVFLLLAAFLLLSAGSLSAQNDRQEFLRRIRQERTDNRPMEQKIDQLIEQMTLEEKVGQMTQVNETFFAAGNQDAEGTGSKADILDEQKLASTIEQYHIGSFLTGGIRPAEEWQRMVRRMQQINMDHSRLDIPIIFGIDHVHGPNYIKEGTIFPQEINLGATFDTTFAWEMGRITAREAAPLGHHWNFAPILDVGREPRWPRLYETFGEDPLLASWMGGAYVNGLQSVEIGPYRMAATAKHYMGYSIPATGWDRTPVHTGWGRIQEKIVPPFQRVVDEGIKSVMINSGEINGVPVHASYKVLTTILRDQLGFKGVALTDWMDIIKLNTEHFVTQNEKESTYKAIMAGVDMSMTPNTVDFCKYLVELVKEGRIPESRIDLSVRRILRLKFQLDLFDHPYPTDKYLDEVGSDEHMAQSRKAAEESIVLLKNRNDLLPLNDAGKILLVGPNADSKNVLAGGWTYTWQGNVESDYPKDMKTLRQAMRAEFKNANILSAKISEWQTKTDSADAIVIAAGEKPYAEGWGNLNDFALPQEQRELIRRAADTGKPVVLVLIEGRPRTIGELADEVDGIVFAGLPGLFGGEAISGVLSGRVNPSGRMSVTYPYKQAHMINYDYKAMQYSYLNVTNPDVMRYTMLGGEKNMGEFGTGLSYSNFEFGNLSLSDTTVTEDGSLTATVTVSNNSDRDGKETVIWFLRDEVGERTRPVKAMKHFEKKMIKAGGKATYTFKIMPREHLGYPDAEGNLQLEEGYYTLTVGDQKARFHYLGS